MTAKRTRRRGAEGVGLVPVKADRLRAAMELGGWTVTTLARRLGKHENPQTVHYLSRGSELRRCRANRRAALAKILDVSEEWLAGGDYGLPLPGVMPLLVEVEGSPRVLLAVGRIFERCYLAVERDLAMEPKRPDLPTGWNATNDVHWFMLSALGALLSPGRWRAALTHPMSKGPPPTLAEVEANMREVPNYLKWFEPLPDSMWASRSKAKALDRDAEEAVLGLIRGWAKVLQSWFDGIAVLDYRRFWDLAGALNPAVCVSIPQSFHARPPVDSLPPAKPTSPYWLVDWPVRKDSA